MSLNNLLAALAENSMLYIEIIEQENTLIEFEAPGYGSLNEDLLLRTVDKVIIDSSNIVPTMKILLSDN